MLLKILDRYILRESVIFFGISLFAFTSILLTVRMLKFASLIVNKGVEAQQILGVFLSIIPTFLEIAIPMATLLGVMMAFARLSGDSEVIVIRASGISIFQLLRPVVIFGIFATLLSLSVSLYLKPWGFKNLSAVLFDIAKTKTTSGLTEGVFNPLGDLMLYAEKIEFQTGELENVLVDDKREAATRKIIIAKSGEILSDPENQTIILHLKDGAIHEVIEKRYVITKFIDNNLAIDSAEIFDPASQKKDPSPRELGIAELGTMSKEVRAVLDDPNYFDDKGARIVPTPDPSATPSIDSKPRIPQYLMSRNEAKKRLNRVNTEFGSRFSMPFASMVLALIALPLGILPPRTQKTWGAGLSLCLGLLVFVLYYGFLSIGITLSDGGSLPATIGVWLPNFASLSVAIFFIWKVGSEQWTSVSDSIGSLGRYLPRFKFLKFKRAQ